VAIPKKKKKKRTTSEEIGEYKSTQ